MVASFGNLSVLVNISVKSDMDLFLNLCSGPVHLSISLFCFIFFFKSESKAEKLLEISLN